nr:hypothetical protein [Hasllibacter halocynthiae]
MALLAGCAAGGAPRGAVTEPVHVGIETRLLDDDLTQFLVEMRGGAGPEDVDAYARCAAAQYALIRGYAFARQVRTQAAERGGTWFGDAVYVISPGLPRGARTIDAEVTVRDCQARGIPTV